MFTRHHHRKLLGHQVRLAFAANSRRINKAKLVAITFHQFIHRIARGSGDRRHDCAVGPGQPIQQRGFANVGVADDSNTNFGC